MLQQEVNFRTQEIQQKSDELSKIKIQLARSQENLQNKCQEYQALNEEFNKLD